ncbi:MAG: SMC-Scp complex subunit ScpB [Planctomycetota bacterium]
MAEEQDYEEFVFKPEIEEPAEEVGGFDDEMDFAHASVMNGDSDDLSTDDLEEAYLKALEAMESAEWAVSEEEEEEAPATEPTGATPADAASLAPIGVEIAGMDFLGGSLAPEPPQAVGELTYDTDSTPPTAVSQPKLAATPTVATHDPSLKPLRVIEACLFVGGQPLPAKKLASLLDGNNDPSDIEKLIDDLNLEYGAQGRPYEIRLVDGGYKLTLRADFEVIRSRVYGMGPRDVKLSQDVLEVLALVAYQQPITQAAVEACKPNSANVLRQLLRRELISLNRVDQSRNGVEYATTPRFLQLFGLAHLNELPRPEDLSIR